MLIGIVLIKYQLHVIIELCSKWIFQIGPNDVTIEFFNYQDCCTSIPMAIELSLNNKNHCDKIFDNALIKKYQINCIKVERNERNQASFLVSVLPSVLRCKGQGFREWFCQHHGGLRIDCFISLGMIER